MHQLPINDAIKACVSEKYIGIHMYMLSFKFLNHIFKIIGFQN